MSTLFSDNFAKFNFYDYFCFSILGNKANNENIFSLIYNNVVASNFNEIFSYDLFISLLHNIEVFIINKSENYTLLNLY
jgi:hypothetical protein